MRPHKTLYCQRSPSECGAPSEGARGCPCGAHSHGRLCRPLAGRERIGDTDADPDGVESFRVTATARNTTESVTIETNVCYGGAYVEVQEDGTLYPYYAIC